MYEQPRNIREPVSNNRLHFHERGTQSIYVPSLIEGTLDDVVTGTETVIEGEVGGKIIAGKGLKHLVYLKNARVPTWIMDNHNHAFAFWHEALQKGYIQEGSLLIHIDQHTDLATPTALPVQSAKGKMQNEGSSIMPPGEREVGGISPKNYHLETLEEVEEYTNTVLTIADFIVPALATGLISEAVMVTGEDMQTSRSYIWEKQKAQIKKQKDGSFFNKNPQFGILNFEFGTPQSLIVDLDLDYFSQGFDEAKTRAIVEYWLAKADIITIATSPLFIEQEKALAILKSLQKSLVTL